MFAIRNGSTFSTGMSLAMISLCVATFSCFLSMSAASGNRIKSPRHSRQTIAGELATGLTGTGTSFSSVDYKTGYLPQESVDGKYLGDRFDGYNGVENGLNGFGLNSWNYHGKGFDHGKGQGYGKGFGGYGRSEYSGYDGAEYGAGLGGSYGAQSWRGFGAGKNPYGEVRPQSQYGLKY